VIASIFVNPLQFGPNEDLGAYPRREAHDRTMLAERGVDLVFIPTEEEMYPSGQDVATVDVGRLARVLEGEHRPGHFDGVTTVVAKLLHTVQPDVLVLGQKDAQQVAVIKKMIEDLSFPTEVLVGETIREADGLALSSRNVYLKREDRDRAPALYQALLAGAAAWKRGASVERTEAAMAEILHGREGIAVDYLRCVDPDTFDAPSARALLLVAARVGPARLIDNVVVEVDG